MLMMLLASFAIAQESQPAANPQPVAGPSIWGPNVPVKVKHKAWLYIQGVEEGGSAAFFPTPFLEVGPPHIVPQHALFWAEKAGEYQVNAVVANVDWDKKQLSIVPLAYIVTVADDEEPPPPPPPPPPGGKYQVMIFTETEDLDNLPKEQQYLINSLVFRKNLQEAGHLFLKSVDIQSTYEGGIPTALQPWFNAVKNKSLPRVAIAPMDGGKVKTFPLSADEAAFMEDLKKGGE